MLRKFLNCFIIFFFFINFIFSYTFIFDDEILKTRDYNVDLIECDNKDKNCNFKLQNLKKNSQNQIKLENLNSKNKNYFIIFKLKDYYVANAYIQSWNKNSNKIFYSSNFKDLYIREKLSYHKSFLFSNKCFVDFSFENNNLIFSTNLNPNPFSDFSKFMYFSPQYLNNYFYMKTFIFLEFKKEDKSLLYNLENFDGKYNYAQNSHKQFENLGYFYKNAYNILSNNNQLNYFLLKPENINYNLLPQITNIENQIKQNCLNDKSFCGEYELKVHMIPIDSKCDIFFDKILNQNEFEKVSKTIKTINIKKEEENQENQEEEPEENNQNENGLEILESFKGPELKDIILDSNNFLIQNDKEKTNKIVVDNITKQVYFINSNFSKTKINLNNLDKKVQIFNKDVLRFDKMKNYYFALKIHNIYNLENANQAENLINSVNYNLNLVKIKKDVTNFNEKSKIKINFLDLNKVGNNVIVYQIIPKENALSFNKIKNLKTNLDHIVFDKDPVIGWHFENPTNNETIEYEIEGDNEGGVIIITDEPVLLNNGDLTINYRQSNCNVDEAFLFSLDNYKDSKVYYDNSHKFKVCISDLEDNLFRGNIYDNSQFLFTINPNNFVSYKNLSKEDDIFVSSYNSNKFWNLHLGYDNPDGNFSCLGSFEDFSNKSRFGDCNFKPHNRIWLYYGEDLIAPNTNIKFPYLAHKVKVFLEARDNVGGSGVNKSYFCIKDDGVDCQDLSDFNEYDNDYFILTCPNNWGCKREVFYFSKDNANNFEEPKSYVINLIDKGTSCQNDCSAKPFPNKIIKDCRNLNGCKFYDYLGDDGLKASFACHYFNVGSWAKFNESYEILCPYGPLRPAKFTTLDLLFTNSLCDNLKIVPYSVILDGQTVKMNIVYCLDYEDLN